MPSKNSPQKRVETGTKVDGRKVRKVATALAKLTGTYRKGPPRKLSDKARAALEAHQFKPGDPRAKHGGRPSNLNLAEKIAQAVLESDPDKIINALAKKAKSGDVKVFEVMRDTGYGKPRQDIGLTGVDPLDKLIESFNEQSEKLEESE